MKKLLPFAMSLLTVTMLFAATAASATSYRVTLTQAPVQEVVIVRSSPWRCAGAECVSSQVRSRPANACGAIARELGSVTAFAVDATTFTADELAACNEFARD